MQQTLICILYKFFRRIILLFFVLANITNCNDQFPFHFCHFLFQIFNSFFEITCWISISRITTTFNFLLLPRIFIKMVNNTFVGFQLVFNLLSIYTYAFWLYKCMFSLLLSYVFIQNIFCILYLYFHACIYIVLLSFHPGMRTTHNKFL